MQSRILLAATALASLTALPALAQSVSATTTNDVTLREGPGSQFDVVRALDKDSNVDVIGCLAERDWCLVDYAGNEGWVYNFYLSGVRDQEVVSLYRNVEGMDIAIIEAEGLDEQRAAVVPAGVLELPDAETTEVVDVSEALRAYVQANPVETVILDGEVVIGAGVPEPVTLYEIPDADYVYANVNATPVVVEPGTRRIVQILR